jgi:hypothetical protein
VFLHLAAERHSVQDRQRDARDPEPVRRNP